MLIKVQFEDNYLSVGNAKIHVRPEDVELARAEADAELAQSAAEPKRPEPPQAP